MARRAPRIASKLRSISSGRAWVSTWIVTSSGTSRCSIEFADKIEIRLRGRRKADLDFLEAELDQKIEHPALAIGPHRLDERLVAVAQIDAAPLRGAVDDLHRPAPVRQINGREGAVFVDGHAGHRPLLNVGIAASTAAL